MKAFLLNPYVILLSIAMSISAAYQHGTVENYIVTIEDKERITTGSGEDISHKYLIFTEEKTFENTDALFHFKFNSSDIQGRMKIGKTYKVKTYGWRIPFFSTYENILSVSELDKIAKLK